MKKIILFLSIACLTLIPFVVKAEDHGGVSATKITPVNQEVKADKNLSFMLEAMDKQGNTWDITPYAFFETDDPRGIMEKNIYKAGKAGTWKVNATYGNFSAETEVTVLPGEVYKIEVNPNSQPETVILGKKKEFAAQAFDEMSNPVKEIKFTWSCEGELGVIDENGVFEARDTGEGKVIATYGSVSGISEIKIREETLLPRTETETETSASEVAVATEEEVTEEVIETEEEGEVAGIETAEAEQVTEEEEECKAMAWYYWLLILIGFIAVLIVYYYFIRKSKNNWWWIFPLILTAVVIWLYYQYSCNKYGWFPWITIIAAILVTLFRPKKYFEEPKEPSF